MNETPSIAPSILSADFLKLGTELDSVRDADLIHYDVMDGNFVSNISFGPGILSTVKGATQIPLDVHLMVRDPDASFRTYLEAGADILTFHMEAATHPRRIVDEIRAYGSKAGVAINPGTSVSSLEGIIDCVDMVLIMSVNPGFGGQVFIDHTYAQLQMLSKLCAEQDAHPIVEVDGGVGAWNAEQLVAAGVDVLVAGSSVFGASDRSAAIREIRDAANRGLALRKA